VSNADLWKHHILSKPDRGTVPERSSHGHAADEGIESPEESRARRTELTKQALADIVRVHLFERWLLQKTVAGKSGISRSHFRALLRAEKQMSLFIFLELSQALGFDDACQLLRRKDLYQDALTAGYQSFKLASFLVRQGVAVERVDILPRMSR